MSETRKCMECREEFYSPDEEQLFCCGSCFTCFKEKVQEMVGELDDEDLIDTFDHIQLLLKKEAQGGEGS